MFIKITGVKYPDNILQVAQLPIDMIGFVFDASSSRYAKSLDMSILRQLPSHILKVGVFVNETLENILTVLRKYSLNAVQVHGADNVELCRTLKEEANVLVIKVFSVTNADNFKVMKDYEKVCDYFLFNTKVDAYVEKSKKFNWNILTAYSGEKEFLLSGNISTDDLKLIFKANPPKMAGLDVGNKFETKPGMMDINQLRAFIEEMNNQTYPQVAP